MTLKLEYTNHLNKLMDNKLMISGIKRKTRHSQLKELLVDKIKNSRTNERLPAERALANEFQVSRPTISKVMIELEQEGYVTRRVGQGTFVSPRDKTVHQDVLKPLTKGTVLIAYPDFFSFPLWEEVHQAELSALKENINLVSLKLQPQTDFSIMFEMIKQTPDLCGVIIHTSADGFPKNFLTRLDEIGVPVAMLCTLENVTLYKNIYEVRFDHFKSGYLRAKCLLEYGHRRIGFVPNEPGLSANCLPIKGMKQAFLEYGLRWKDIAQPQTEIKSWQDPMKLGYWQALELLNDKSLTALLFDTIHGTLGGLRAIYENKLSCPDDISVITSMGHMGYEEMSCPSLTTIASDSRAIIQKAFEVILAPSKNATKSILIDVNLVERESIKKIC